MSILDPTTIAVITTATAGSGVYLRNIFAKAAASNAMKKAEPVIKALKSGSSFSAAFDPVKRGNVEKLSALLQTGASVRKLYISEIEKLKILSIKEPPEDKILNDEFVAMGRAMMWGSAGIESYNFSSVYAAHIKTMMSAAGKTAEHATQATNFIDAHIIEALDKSGISDVVMQTVHGLGEHIPNVVIDAGITIMHEALLPGVMTAIRTVISESKLAFDGETNWEDSLVYGVLPAIGTFAMVKGGMIAGGAIGAKVDLVTGGATMGAGTLVGGLGGLGSAIWGRHKFIGAQIDEDKDSLRPLAQRIKKRGDEGRKAINTVILDKSKRLESLKDNCPEITQYKTLKDIFERMSTATSDDFQAARTAIEFEYKESISALPARSWLERIAFTDRHVSVRRAYSDAASDQIESLRDLKARLSTLIDYNNPEAAFEILLNNPFFKNGKLEELIASLPDDIIKTAKAYDSEMKQWGASCKTHWNETKSAVTAETKVMKTGMTRLRQELATTINPLRMRIKANCKRLGRAPDPMIYV